MATFAMGCVASRSRLSASTLTRGSPRNPNCLPSGVSRDQLADGIFAHAPLTRHARNLKLRTGGGDIRIEAGGRCCQQVDGNGLAGILRLQPGKILFEAVDEFLVGRSKVGAAGVRRVIAVARGRRPRVEVAGTAKRLSNEARAHDLPVPLDELLHWPCRERLPGRAPSRRADRSTPEERSSRSSSVRQSEDFFSSHSSLMQGPRA